MNVNPMQALVDAIGKDAAAERSRSQMTLGSLIALLRTLPADRLVKGLGGPDSYRGYYSDLAFAPTEETRTVGDLLLDAESCMGRVFEGYKGGEFPMHARTPLWVSRYGSASGDRLMDLDVSADPILPETAQEEW